MPPGTASDEPVPLRQRCCKASGCGKTFYLCKSCDRGQCYCSPRCRADARKSQRRLASARYQQTPEGRLGHCDCQRAYRERQRARSAIPVTDPSSISSNSPSSCGSDHARPTPLIQTPCRTHAPQPPQRASPVFRCLVCGRTGFLQKGDADELDQSSRQP